MNKEERYEKAFVAWRELLTNRRVLTDGDAVLRYTRSTLGGTNQSVLGTLFPHSVEEVVGIVKIATRYEIALYPISVGNNWGYGSRTPVTNACVIVDLSKMNKILDMDDDLGLLTIEPGVTAIQLQQFLVSRASRFLPLTSGAGPNVGILGNILERGYGSSSGIDRFASLMALDVVLADGTVYRSALSEGKSVGVENYFKWGIGPYIDGLFSQSNLGIVIRATIALTPKPSKTEIFFVLLKKEETIQDTVTAIRNSLNILGSAASSIRLQSPYRTFARLMKYPEEKDGSRNVLTEDFINAQLKHLGLDRWVVMGSVQGDPRIVRAARGVIKNEFKQHAQRVLFFSERSLYFFKWVRKYSPRRFVRHFAFLSFVESYLKGAEGELPTNNPRTPLWKQPVDLEKSRSVEVDFDLDPRCGLIFFAPVVPLDGKVVEKFIYIVKSTCTKYGIEPLLAFNNFSDRCFHVSLPLLFDKSSSEETQKAHACYRELFAACKAENIHVYRAGTHAMDLVVDMEHPFWQVAEKIKKALDPLNIMSPGRYSSYKGPDTDSA